MLEKRRKTKRGEGNEIKILVLNLGSTSTKAGIFEGTKSLVLHTIRHSKEDLAPYPDILSQKVFRKVKLLEWLNSQKFEIRDADIIAARGGLIRPVHGGVYLVNEAAARDARGGRYGMHPANVGLLIAHEWSQEYGVPAVFVDGPTTCELSPRARVSGFAGTARRSVFHALNMKRVIRLYCEEAGKDPFLGRYIVAHMGGGITVGAFSDFRAIDVNNGVDGEGPFTPERAGSLSTRMVLDLLKKCKGDTELTYERLYREGGLVSYFGTNDVRHLSARAYNEPSVKLVLDAMFYGVTKQIGAMAAVLDGQVDQIFLTGGVAFNQELMDALKNQVQWIAPCRVYPGEDELAALAEGAWRYLSGAETAESIEN